MPAEEIDVEVDADKVSIKANAGGNISGTALIKM
jgi:hypothetical protein